MQAWPAPPLPRLSGHGRPPVVHDTASGELRPVADAATLRMYVCGITPYDATHLGHAATYVAFDVLQRVARDAGLQVRYVQNVTDVDDPLLERATATGVDWGELASEQIALYRTDMAALRVLPPDDFVGAVEAIPEILELVGELRARGAAYELDGDIYFSVSAAPRFGAVGHLPLEVMLQLAAERGGDPERPGKKDPLDAVLWRAARAGEPAWDSPLGRGRPGWHVECTAIALRGLGASFDLQGGGSDLVFPHHELGAAMGEVATGAWPYARNYVHAGMVGLAGEKMSKSRGNLVLVSQLRAAGGSPAAIRLAILDHHYRADWDWTPEQLARATERLASWGRAVSLPAGPDARGVLSEVRRELGDDLQTPEALRAVDRWAQAAEAGTSAGNAAAPGQVRDLVDALLGVDLG